MIDILFPALLACIGAWLGFANPLAHLPPLALLFPIGLIIVANGAPTLKSAFRRGMLTGAAAGAGALYWIALPVHDFGGLHWVLAGPCPILVGLVLGLYTGTFCVGIRAVRGRLSWPLLAVYAGALWWIMEIAKGLLFTGFPWLVLASAFSPWPFAIQGAAIVGAYGLSGVLAACAALLAEGGSALFSRPRLAAALALALLAVYGHWTLGRPMPDCGTARVALVQGNIDQSLKWDDTFRLGTIDRYTTLSRTAAEEQRPDLIVWPETALPFYLQELNSLSMRVRKLARELETPILTGSPAYTFISEEKRYILYNRAYLVDGQGRLKAHYDKEHLVPFGEYVPLGEYLPFITKLVHGIGDFVPGSDVAPLDTGSIRAGVLLCYESIFPELGRNRVEAGANLLVNISNDAWFGRSSAPYQHFYLTLLRTVEQGRSMVRGTNTGISAFIDPRGRVIKHGGLFRSEALVDEVPLCNTATPYSRMEHFLVWLPLALLILCGLFAATSRKRT